jgi:hypothetical protein
MKSRAVKLRFYAFLTKNKIPERGNDLAIIVWPMDGEFV